MCSLESYMEGEGREEGGSGRKTSQDIPLECINYWSDRNLKILSLKVRWKRDLPPAAWAPSTTLSHNGSPRSIEVWETKLALFLSSSEALLRFANRCDNKS
jgi:hypothetical protein